MVDWCEDSKTLDEKLTDAVNEVAMSLPEKQQSKARSDLLQKLQEHSLSAESQQPSANVGSLFTGLRIDKSGTSVSGKAQQKDVAATGRRERDRASQTNRVERRQRSEAVRRHRSREVEQDFKLFEGPSLGIFAPVKPATDEDQGVQRTLFDKLSEEELTRLVTLPPNNAFEEMIRWTSEGKLWTFPIDNEQGMDDEAKVGFHEHIFLEQLIDDRFPARGPIRHFMELVAVGLSKNSYLTVAEKHAHIAWYAEYFQDKYEIFENSQAVASEAMDEQQSAVDKAAGSE